MTVTTLSSPPDWMAVALRILAESGPLTVPELMPELTKHHAVQRPGDAPELSPAEVERELLSHGEVYEGPEGWYNLVTVADGTVLTHVLDEDELAGDVLIADGDLDLWARLAERDLPLAGGGMVRTRWADEQEPLPFDASVGLTGPGGWLDGFLPGSIVGLRLRDGALSVERLDPALDLAPDEPGALDDDVIHEQLSALVPAAGEAAAEALAAYVSRLLEQTDGPEVPGAELGGVVAGVLTRHPGLLEDPLPPLSLLLRMVGLEVRSRYVSLPGVPWPDHRTEDLSPEELGAYTLASSALTLQTIDEEIAPLPLEGVLELLEHPAILDLVAGDAEADPLPGELLASLLQEAATPQQRAVARILAARAAEGEGLPANAEPLVHEALADWPDCPSALYDAATYAADRGDVRAADQYLRRLGMPSDHGLAKALLPLLETPIPQPATAPDTKDSRRRSRRTRSPSQPSLDQPGPHQVLHPLPARAPLAFARLAEYACRSASREVLEYLLGMTGAQARFLALDLTIFDMGVGEDYLRERRPLLPDDEAELVEAWLEVPLALYEVVTMRPGEQVTLRPLPEGEPVFLPESAFSGEASQGDLVLARLLHDGAGPRMFTPAHQVDPSLRDEILEILADDDYEPEEIADLLGG